MSTDVYKNGIKLLANFDSLDLNIINDPQYSTLSLLAQIKMGYGFHQYQCFQYIQNYPQKTLAKLPINLPSKKKGDYPGSS